MIKTNKIPRKILEKALLTRFAEEKLLDLFSSGKLNGTVHTSIGQELSGAIISNFLTDDDTIFSNHRCHGHFLSKTLDINGLISELMGRETGVCMGIGGSQHLYKNNFYSNGIQGGIVPIAAGLAYAHKLQNKNNISVVFIGDGTLGEGVVYEAMNLVSKWNLPLLIVLEDNKYSQSTCQESTLAGDILSRPLAFGIESVKSNTWEWEHLIHVSDDLIKKIRSDSKPRFLQIETFRLKAHSKGDDNRSEDLIKIFNLKDPLNIFLGEMTDQEGRWVETIRNQVENAVLNAENSPIYDITQAIKKDILAPRVIEWIDFQPHTGLRFVDSLNKAFVTLMGEIQDLYMLGEDIESPYGGAFKATKDLSQLFPERVRNTPISEACIVGVGGGMGLLGFTAVVEIMFGDFIGLAFDQIVNHVAKFKEMYGNNVHTNVIIRTPMGGGRGYGPTHSQTLDKHFLGIPGIKVIALNNYVDPIEIFRPLIQEQLGPAIIIENKIMYGSFCYQNIPDGFTFKRSSDKFPNILVSPDASAVDITFIGYGGMSDLLIQACDVLFEEYDIVAQVILITQLYPLDITASIKSIREAKAMIVVEEGQGFSGFGSEVISQIFENNLTQCKVKRIFSYPTCIPSSSILEKEVLPSINKIIECALTVINYD